MSNPRIDLTRIGGHASALAVRHANNVVQVADRRVVAQMLDQVLQHFPQVVSVTIKELDGHGFSEVGITAARDAEGNAVAIDQPAGPYNVHNMNSLDAISNYDDDPDGDRAVNITALPLVEA